MEDLVLISPPNIDAVTLAEAKAHLRVDHTDDDTFIASALLFATQRLDPASVGALEFAIRPQTWELRLSCFPTGWITLRHPPLIGIVSVKYDDGDGVEQTIDPEDYRILAGGPLSASRLGPAYGSSWPSNRADAQAVRIRYTAGHPLPAEDERDPLPQPIKNAILMMVGDLYAFRETVVIGVTAVSAPVAASVDKVIAPFTTLYV